MIYIRWTSPHDKINSHGLAFMLSSNKKYEQPNQTWPKMFGVVGKCQRHTYRLLAMINTQCERKYIYRIRLPKSWLVAMWRNGCYIICKLWIKLVWKYPVLSVSWLTRESPSFKNYRHPTIRRVCVCVNMNSQKKGEQLLEATICHAYRLNFYLFLFHFLLLFTLFFPLSLSLSPLNLGDERETLAFWPHVSGLDTQSAFARLQATTWIRAVACFFYGMWIAFMFCFMFWKMRALQKPK